MDWTGYIDGYCERTDPSLWSEPLNAVTNLAFLLAAWVMWGRVRGQGMPLASAMVGLLAAIGLGSFLFHTVATAWASVFDVVPIGLFILLYIFAANRDFWGLPAWAAAIGAALFIPYAVYVTPVFAKVPFFAVSAFYWPVPLMIVVYAILLVRRNPDVSRGLSRGAAILVISLVFRTIDEPICAALPIGTHFLWHLLNAVMLGWMIELYRRDRAARA